MLLMALFVVSCVKEDMAECDLGLTINFKYSLNNKEEDLFDSSVRDMRLYVFDNHGILCDVIRENGTQLNSRFKQLVIPQGVYTFVAWGGSGEEMMDSFKEIEMVDEVTNNYISSVQIGITTLDNFRMKLIAKQLPQEIEGEIAPQTEEFDHLFYGVASNFEVTGSNQLMHIDLIKNTNTLRVKVAGLQHLTATIDDQAPVSLWTIGRNERYKFDNSLGDYARFLRNEPHNIHFDESSVFVDIKMLRFDKSKHLVEPIWLKTMNLLTGIELLAPIDILETILRAKDTHGNLLFRTQTDLDKEDEYFIEINIAKDLSVTVEIKNWTIVDTTPDIGRD